MSFFSRGGIRWVSFSWMLATEQTRDVHDGRHAVQGCQELTEWRERKENKIVRVREEGMEGK
jgi:hypothetical protein